jgi:hypothetical protein
MKWPADLTKQQWRCVLAVRDLTRRAAFPPTLSSLSAHMGIKGIGAVTHVLRCKALGYLTSAPHKARSFRLTDKAMRAL